MNTTALEKLVDNVVQMDAHMGENWLKRVANIHEWSVDMGRAGVSPSVDVLLAISRAMGIGVDMLLTQQIVQRMPSHPIRMLVTDVDGVLTDGGMYYTESGDEFKKFNAKDGLALRRLTKAGFAVGIISSGFNVKLINRRGSFLGIEYIHAGMGDKATVLEGWCATLGIGLQEVGYVGDDLNDMSVMRKVGWCACPADAVGAVKQVVDVVLQKRGGEGCIREFVDLYIRLGDG